LINASWNSTRCGETDVDSAQLAGAQARIIITTLQKFPIVISQGITLPDRRYAVIVDEAHSSQTGESVKDLKAVLGATEDERLDAAECDESAAGQDDPLGEALAEAARARGKQRNISFFAFTATPKGRTLEHFGRLNPMTGRYEAFHTYSMRQAIEEKFILDVLANYVTYQTFWNIEKRVAADPNYDPKKAGAAIARFVSLHERNLAQKAEVIIEHFRRHVRHKIGGRAKAMVVTASRLHAVRYVQALRAYCKDKGYDIGVLVAFSGTVLPDTEKHTESSLNEFPESQTVERFATGEWHVLVVAEKYQTGFDQPLLYAMYVDKLLSGLAAVQTLSRLNRTCDGKDGTFVLDFRNDTEDIRESFSQWYTTTVAQPTDPNLLYDTRHALDSFGVLWPEESSAPSRCCSARSRRTATADCTPRSPRPSTGSPRWTTTRRIASATRWPGSPTPTHSCPRSCRSPTSSWKRTTCSAGRSPRSSARPARPDWTSARKSS
jgi:type I restriction enzyme, R subunit